MSSSKRLLILSFLLLFIVTMSSSTAFAQDPQFSQFYANPLYLNPAFTGNTPQLRLATTYRNQWPSIPKGYISYTATVDYNIEKISSGVGLLATHDKAGTNGLSFTNIGLLYSKQIRLSKLVYLNGGTKFSYTSRSVNQSDLIFSDQIIRDGAPTSVETFGENINHIDISSGLLLTNVKKYWFGVSLDHLNQPSYSFLDNGTTVDIKTSIHAGWNFEVTNESKISKPGYIKAVAHYKAQGRWDQFDLGAYYEKDPMFVGIWYRGIPLLKRYDGEFPNNESVILLLGVNVNDIRFGYSYDLTISGLARNSGGAHEISIVYEYLNHQKKKKRRRFLVPCPKF